MRDCDFNDTAPAAVTVARMVEAKRAAVVGSVAELPLEDKKRALALALLKLFGGPLPPDGTAPNVIRMRLPWYPPTYPFKVRSVRAPYRASWARLPRLRRPRHTPPLRGAKPEGAAVNTMAMVMVRCAR